MSLRITLLLSLFFVVFGRLSAQPDIHQLIDRLASAQNYRASFSYTVTLPLTDSEVEYQAELSYARNSTDSLGGYSYRIDYKAENDTCPYRNFVDYDHGNYFRFDRSRLREYHYSDNPDTFVPQGNNPGVHRSGLFVELLPAEIARQLQTFGTKTDCLVQFFPDTLVQERTCHAVFIADSLKGEAIRTILYTFDPENGMPLYRETENNPGHLGAQTVVVRYETSEPGNPFPQGYFGEQQLLRDYGEIFFLFREGTYAATDRTGQKNPPFSLKWGESRFSSEQLDGQNALLLFLDDQGEFCNRVRQIADSIALQENITPVLLYVGQKTEESNTRSGAIVLENARKTAGEYGVTGYPTLFLLDPQGVIRLVKIGYSPYLSDEILLSLRKIEDERELQSQY